MSGWEAEDSVRFYRLYVEQELFAGGLRVKAGQFAADDDFFLSRYALTFVNGVFGDFTFHRALPTSPVYPLSAPGLYLETEGSERWFARIGVYAADAGKDRSSNIGFDWSLQDGAALFAEVGARRVPLGLPGTYTLGSFGDTSSQVDFDDGGKADGLLAIYAMFDQALALDAAGEPQAGAFLRASVAPQSDRSVVRWHVDGGLNFFGPIPGRRRDVLGVAVSYNDFASDYLSSQRASGQNVTGDETVVELTSRAAITSWLSLQPDLQLFFDPHFGRRDAVVVGLRALVDLWPR